MDVVIPTDRPKSIHNRDVIEFFEAFCVVTLPFDISFGIGLLS